MIEKNVAYEETWCSPPSALHFSSVPLQHVDRGDPDRESGYSAQECSQSRGPQFSYECTICRVAEDVPTSTLSSYKY